MQEQEGEKPQLKIVAAKPEPETSYTDHVEEVIASLSKQKRAGTLINIPELMRHLSASENNAAIRDWLADNDVLTKASFNRLLAKKQSDEKVEAEIGFLPRDALDFVRRYAEHHNITLTPKGTLKRKRSYDFKRFVNAEGEVKPSENRTMRDLIITEANAGECPETQLIYDVINNTGDNLDTFARELRLVTDRLNLGYRDSVISDAIQTWQDETNQLLKVATLQSIAFEKGRATGPLGTEMWAAMEAACFDMTNTAPGFAVAVLRKFMWQVKRKARGLSVTNHLMPVITGPQGKGKTEFVKAMTKPLRDLMREVDFNMLTDGKTTDIWKCNILFIDEMGFFSKADVDQVKNLITTENLSIRTMRQNHSAVIQNEATLIGCSNKALGQLIRDDTGVRRFAELVWRLDPDWEASNKVDWPMLWKSVDENGPDPIIAADLMGVLRDQQEANRNQSPVELWARTHGSKFDKWSSPTDLHTLFRDWEKEAFPRFDTNLVQFGRQLSNLIETLSDFPMEKRAYKNANQYRAKQ